jgi:type IV secretory pathway VirB2 component (pilin)
MKNFFNTLSQCYLQDQYFYLRIIYFFLFTFAIFNGFDAFAGGATVANADDPIGDQLCKILTTLNGNTAKVIGGAALMATGLSFFMGKVNWGVIITTTSGVIIVFGSGQIVGFLSGTGDGSCVPKNGA